MVNVHDYAHSLARALKESPEHRAFQDARTRIKGKASAEKMIADFHQKQVDLQSQALQGKEPTEQQKQALQQLYAVISGDPDAAQYLMAEQRLTILLNDIYKIIGDALDIPAPGQ